jgi:hypothetical protein
MAFCIPRRYSQVVVRNARRNNRAAGNAAVSERVRLALRKESWGRTALQLAWTAGPVTYLALQGGYILGYGQSAPSNLFIYFAGYTLIAGVAAIVVRVIYNATRGREVEEGKEALNGALDQLPRLILAARSAALRSYAPDDAHIVAAYHLLSNPESSEEMIGIAIRDLGGSEKLAVAFRRMEAYRRQGLAVMVARERSLHEADIARFYEQLRQTSPDLAYWIAERAAGRAPDRRRGRRRTEGFLERTLTAAEGDDLSYMSGGDAQELLSLTAELLAGRRFPLILFRYQGARDAASAWAELDSARREYRSRVRSRNSRLRTAAEALGDGLDQVLPSVARIVGTRSLVDAVAGALRSEVARLTRRRPATAEHDRAAGRVRHAIHRYGELERSTEQLERSHARLARAMRRYYEVTERYAGESESGIGLDSDDSRPGVLIDEREIALGERARHAIARDLRARLVAMQLWNKDDIEADIVAFRELAVGIVGELERHLQLYRTEIQQAIELNRAPYFEALAPGLSPAVRAEWVVALVNEVEDDVPGYALKRVEQLVRFHGLRLEGPTVRLLGDRLGIPESSLEELQKSVGAQSASPPHPPVTVPKLAAELREKLAGVRR